MPKINKTREIVLVLPNIRSAQNVGSIFRTADAAGVSKVYITGYTPCPIDRFGKPRKDISKTSLGAETWIPWEYKKMPLPLIKKLKQNGYSIVSLEQASNSLNYKKCKFSEKIVLVLGNEVDGISKNILDISDVIIEIPMRGKKESLNVSVATGIALFHIGNV